MWNIITNYPHHPSPYFSALDRAFAAEGIECRFFADLGNALDSTGFINLHRLQRLYCVNDRPDADLLDASLHLLSDAKRKGLKIAWTVHNLLPINKRETVALDHDCMQQVLTLCDVVVCHSQADAQFIRQLAPDVELSVCGSAGLWMPENEGDQNLTPLLQEMEAAEQAFLAFGHITAYKDLLRVGRAFLDSTSKARLFIAGEARDPELLQALRSLEAASAGRLMLWPWRVDPADAHRLYKRCTAAICSYVTSGRYAYFRDVLHPSSIATARGFNIPLITADTPSTRELAVGVPALFYKEGCTGPTGIERTLRLAEERFAATTFHPRTAQDEWIGIARVYKSIESRS